MASHRRLLYKAVAAGDLGAVTSLLEDRGFVPNGRPNGKLGYLPSLGGPNDLAERDDVLCDTPLHVAARLDSASIARCLIQASADTSLTNVDGATPLHTAASAGSLDVLAALLEEHPEVDAKDSEHLTPLHRAAAEGHAECVRQLIMAGAAPSSRDAESLTPLHRATTGGGHAAVVELLLAESPASMLCVDDFCDGAVVAAVRQGKLSVVVKFLDAGLQVNAPDAFNSSLLQLASYYGHGAVVRQLLLENAEVNFSAGEHQLNSLHLAAMQGHSTAVGHLLAANADTGAVGGLAEDSGRQQRRSPLHYAAAAGHTEVVTLLLESGADPALKDSRRCTARELAISSSHLQVSRAIDMHVGVWSAAPGPFVLSGGDRRAAAALGMGGGGSQLLPQRDMGGRIGTSKNKEKRESIADRSMDNTKAVLAMRGRSG
jgi:ankyrin repeat protein